MPTIAYDGQSLLLDGKRRWIVAGSADYARIPREEWAARLRTCRLAGLNTIGVSLNWRLHEPAPGRFDFDGNLDIEAFIREIGRAGMSCILRPGPFVDRGWDMGGLPTWLLQKPGAVLRGPGAEFLEPCARWFGAVMGEVKDLQATSRRGGPIILIHVEHEWHCGDEAAGEGYLAELTRFLRENGAATPLVNNNNLFQHIESQIDAWSGSARLHSTMRQLRHVRPDAPPMVIDLSLGGPDVWGAARGHAAPAPAAVLRRVAEALAAGAQVHLAPFCGGTNFGFQAGRIASGPAAADAAAGGATRQDAGAAIAEGGATGPAHDLLKRILTFASSFDRVFTALELSEPHVAIDPEGADGEPSVSAIHCTGAQGDVVFVFGDARGGRADATRTVRLTQPDGASLFVTPGATGITWLLRDALLAPRARLDWCNLCPFALVGRVFACFGPAGAHGMLSINGAAFELIVPEGAEPLVEEHEGIVVVACNETQIDAAFATESALFVGASGVDGEGRPLPRSGFDACLRLSAEGEATREAFAEHANVRAPSLGEWSAASAEEYTRGASDRFASISGPASLESLGAPEGYGWIRMSIPAKSARKAGAGFFESGDRLHLFGAGEFIETVGEGPGATGPLATLPLKSGANMFVALADNIGRWSSGVALGEKKGLFGHVWLVKPLKSAKPVVSVEAPINPLALRSPLWGVHRDDRTDPARLAWKFEHRRKAPVFVVIDPPPSASAGAHRDGAGHVRALLLLNSDLAGVVGDLPLPQRFTLDPEGLKRGVNHVQLAFLGDAAAMKDWAASAVHFFVGDTNLTEKADWGFARWEPPRPAAFQPANKTALGKTSGVPTWWRTEFKWKSSGRPLWLEAKGLTKGQMFLNGKNLCRYWVATRDGTSVPPQERYFLPHSWLRPDDANELLIFDEHGAAPGKARLTTSAE